LLGNVVRQDLDGDGAIKSRVTRSIHLAHSSGSYRDS
jgi:hypothetical protein